MFIVNKIEMSIEEVVHHFLKIKNPTLANYRNHLNKILDFVDRQFFASNLIVDSMASMPVSGIFVFEGRYKNFKGYDFKYIINSINVVTDAFSKFVLSYPRIIDQEIFTEIKAMIRYFTKKIVTNESITDLDPMKISDDKLFNQAETFIYMYSFFDKLNYVFIDLNNKKKNGNDESEIISESYFGERIIKEIQPFTKGVNEMYKIQKIIEMITNSSAWHYCRKLRNIIVHRRSNPDSTFNLALSIKLLYINICRIVFLLDATIKKDDEISASLNEKNSK
jgi:hypothetical protein